MKIIYWYDFKTHKVEHGSILDDIVADTHCDMLNQDKDYELHPQAYYWTVRYFPVI